MHLGWIRQLEADGGGRFLVTTGDGTARLWEAATGRLLRVFRVPDQAWGVALSADGAQVAVGCRAGAFIFERATGQLLRVLRDESAFTMRYSPDGRFLAYSYNSHELRVYSLPDYQLAFQVPGADNCIHALAWSTAGQLAVWASGAEPGLRLFSASGQLLAKCRPPELEKVWIAELAFSPDGGKLAVNGLESSPLVLSARDLSVVSRPDPSDYRDAGGVAWSPDGQWLYGGARLADGRPGLRLWQQGRAGGFRELPLALSAAPWRLRVLPDGRLAAATERPELALFAPDGSRLCYRTSSCCRYRRAAADQQLQPSADGSSVRFRYPGDPPCQADFSPAGRELRLSEPTGPTNMAEAPAPVPGLSVARRTTGPPGLRVNGRELAFPELAWYSLSAAAQRVAVVSYCEIALLDPRGEQTAAVPFQDAQATAFSGDGKLLLVGGSDGAIHWYRVSDGQEVLAFFPHADRRRWVLWTPGGYYDCAPGAEELIGWQVDSGADQAAEFYPASRFRSTYYRPDVVTRVLTTLDEATAVRQANDEAGRPQGALALARMLPPAVTLLRPKDGAELSGDTLTVLCRVKAAADAAVTGLKVLVNGRPAAIVRGAALHPPAGDAHLLSLPAPTEDCEVSVIAENRHGSSVAAVARLQRPRDAARVRPGLGDNRPKLYVLAVGVGAYQLPELRLAFAAKDANDFAAAALRQRGGLYRDVTVRLLTDAQASRDEIVDGLDWILHQTTARDVAMVFLSGHGENDERNNYYFLPANFDPERFKRTGVPWSEIRATVEGVAGRVLFFVDSCHSGGALAGRKGMRVFPLGQDTTALVNTLASAESGAVVFAAAAGKQVAFENPDWGNGAFTKALVEALHGQAVPAGQRELNVSTLEFYVAERVKQLTGGRQTPSTLKPATIPDFALAVPEATIPPA